MELRHLHYFVTVAAELNFSRAAQRLHIAQPPLSQQIRQLETELGFELFHRTKRSVQLTQAGRVFLVQAEKILQQVEQAVEMGRLASRGEVGQLVVGFVSSAAYSVLPPILQAFRQAVPNVSLELRELTTNQQLQLLVSGQIDIGLVRPPVEQPEIHSEVIFQEPLMLAMPVSHRLAKRTKVSIKSLVNEPFILFRRSLAPGLYDPIISLCQQAGFSPNVVQEAIQMQTIVSLVAAQMGIAVVSASLQNLQRSGVIYKALKEKTPLVALALIWRPDCVPTVERFLRIARTGYDQSFSLALHTP
ncbi:LysR family transcriptional regulator [[Phormidium ambiguum] IAM M-71]|uniref:LysR family transcriptional regulator n=1 Tax=[Phormidium ambiguum] IAM M-71 TaxID=454136 RepID=A0A1U7IFC8_9CYAN|nr:LysR family transcriptional regulator [Phormidium ambiguum]OKH35738.1 LysR family transcriptional regulator [Phormidium ambiguum IAM M-71]